MNHDKKPHLKAVALRYLPDEHDAPIITAKGQGYVAENIIKRAQHHGVPIQEDASLVEVLAQLNLEQQIPASLYQVVAEVLTFIYQSDQKAKMMKEQDI